MDKPWLIASDFNEIKEPSEKTRGSPTNARNRNNFASWINNCGLIDLGFVGSRYTWRGSLWNGYDSV
ncbi:hypothetical protein AHAS_Ahas05G0125900 [Arachis hypogaea]